MSAADPSKWSHASQISGLASQVKALRAEAAEERARRMETVAMVEQLRAEGDAGLRSKRASIDSHDCAKLEEDCARLRAEVERLKAGWYQIKGMFESEQDLRIKAKSELAALRRSAEDAHSLIRRARAYIGHGSGPLSVPFAGMVESALRRALQKE